MTNTPAGTSGSFLRRVIGAALLRASTYEDVEADRGATGQAMAVVALSSLAAGIGARGVSAGNPGDAAAVAGVALLAWVAWAWVVYTIGALLLPVPQTRADVGELLRTTGFATAPGLIRVLGVWPGLAAPAYAISTLWMLLAMIVAVRQALEYTTTRRAVGVCVAGWVLALAIVLAFGLLFGPRVS